MKNYRSKNITKYRYPKRSGRGNYPFYSKWWDKFYTKPGYKIVAHKNNPNRLYKKRINTYKPF